MCTEINTLCMCNKSSSRTFTKMHITIMKRKMDIWINVMKDEYKDRKPIDRPTDKQTQQGTHTREVNFQIKLIN